MTDGEVRHILASFAYGMLFSLGVVLIVIHTPGPTTIEWCGKLIQENEE